MTAIDIRLPGAAPGDYQELARFHLNNEVNQTAIALQPLKGCGIERWLAPGSVSVSERGRFSVATSAHYQYATTAVPVTDGEIRTVSEVLYRELLSLVMDSDHPQMVRIWNYVPGINRGADDSEVYRQFCWGRADALIDLDEQALPAATAIGSADGVLRVSLLSASSAVAVRHLENPRQVSAYHYPRQYGPRSPSFARATEINLNGDALLLLSGTSSIVAHETRHAYNLCRLTAETRWNIDELLKTAQHAADLEPLWLRFYLRDPAALQEAQAAYAASFEHWPAAAFLQGDICREALQMEIDGVFSTLG